MRISCGILKNFLNPFVILCFYNHQCSQSCRDDPNSPFAAKEDDKHERETETAYAERMEMYDKLDVGFWACVLGCGREKYLCIIQCVLFLANLDVNIGSVKGIHYAFLISI